MQADLWQRGCERLASELPDQQFNTWIRPLPEADVADTGEGAIVTVRVPNRFKLDWIRNQYAGRIETVLSELAGKPVLLLSGANDSMIPAGPRDRLAAVLQAAGADLVHKILPAGHNLTPNDLAIAAPWLEQLT